MVSSVSSTPYYSYLSQLQGSQSAGATVPKPPVTTPAAGSDNTDSASLVSSLLGSGGYSPTVLSLLQENGSGGFDPIANLLGGKSADNGLTKLYTNIYNSSSASTLQQAKLDNPKPVKTPSPIQNLLDSSTKAAVAYNQTIQQNAAAAVTASKARTDAITSLVS